MPARTSSGTAAAAPGSQLPSLVDSKFELPALDFEFSSLTEGTGIPPPEPSPVHEVPTPPKTPKAGKNRDAKANGHQGSPTSNAESGTINRPHDDVPASPALSSRGSIRRLISKTLLNNSYANGEMDGIASDTMSRPESRATTFVMSEKKSRRASGFFRKLRGGDRDQKRGSVSVDKEETAIPPPTPKGPPPPMIPEFNALNSKIDVQDGGSLGSDLFRDIN